MKRSEVLGYPFHMEEVVLPIFMHTECFAELLSFVFVMDLILFSLRRYPTDRLLTAEDREKKRGEKKKETNLTNLYSLRSAGLSAFFFSFFLFLSI